MDSRLAATSVDGISTLRMAMHFGCFSTAIFMNVLLRGREARRGRVGLATKYLVMEM
jgi:hypothetical protein